MKTPLPKKHNRKEAKYDSLVAAHLHKMWPRSFALEVKVDKGKLKPHQEAALSQVAKNKFKPYKIPDMGKRNPFDYVGFRDADPLVCTVDSATRKVHCEVYNGTYEFNFKI